MFGLGQNMLVWSRLIWFWSLLVCFNVIQIYIAIVAITEITEPRGEKGTSCIVHR